MYKKIIPLMLALLLIPIVSASTINLVNPSTGDIRVLSSQYDPTPAEPGNYLDIWINVQNWGAVEIRGVNFLLEPEYPFSFNPGDDGIHNLGLLGSWSDAEIKYQLRVDSNALEDSYNLTLRQCADVDCEELTKSFKIPVTVKTGGTSKIEVGLEDFTIYSENTRGIVTLNVVNRGRLDVKFLTLELLDSEEYEIISPSRVYVGELESDDFDTADFDIYIKDADGNVELPIKVDYSDENYGEYIDDEILILKIYSSDELKKMGLVQAGGSSWITVVGILVVAGGAYWYWKKKTKKKLVIKE